MLDRGSLIEFCIELPCLTKFQFDELPASMKSQDFDSDCSKKGNEKLIANDNLPFGRSKSLTNIRGNTKRLKNNLIKMSDEITKQKRIKTLTDFLEIKDEIIDFEEIVEIKINNISLS